MYSKKKGMVPLRSEQFGERVMFTGNLDKNDLSFTLSDVQLEDEGIYNCYVKNPPDRIRGHGVIQLNVVTKRKALTLSASWYIFVLEKKEFCNDCITKLAMQSWGCLIYTQNSESVATPPSTSTPPSPPPCLRRSFANAIMTVIVSSAATNGVYSLLMVLADSLVSIHQIFTNDCFFRCDVSSWSLSG